MDSTNKNVVSVGIKILQEKTKIVVFCRLRKLHDYPTIKLDNKLIQSAEVIKLLCLTLNKKLAVKHRIINLSNTTKKLLNPIKYRIHNGVLIEIA